jgi:hypothetical protein
MNVRAEEAADCSEMSVSCRISTVATLESLYNESLSSLLTLAFYTMYS